ncbi:acyl transferase domain-containing protein [Xylaria sp. FL1042]|nr:acyl transferase domain-containing protein [Xylaria sp. FL1042]
MANIVKPACQSVGELGTHCFDLSSGNSASTTKLTPSISTDDTHSWKTTPIAICGVAMRLPGGVSSAKQLWDLILNKGDGCVRIPADRYGTHASDDNNVTSADTPNWKTHAYMLDHVDLASFDSALFSMTRAELGIIDPQQRLLLEITRECFETAGETGWRGKDVGVYIGTFGEDWNDIQYHDRQDSHLYKLAGAGDFIMANRISYEYDLKGPSLVLRTGCSASLYCLHLACRALQEGETCSALVGGSNLIMNPSKVETMFNMGVLSNGASSRSFDAEADGYARGEAVSMVFLKRLDDALRDGSPIRAVIRATATNSDGKTSGLTKPSGEAHETLIRSAYLTAGLEDEMHKTGFFECHATGTPSGDPEEAGAVARVFGSKGGVYIGSVKPNLGHSEGASGLSSLLKCIMALENRIIPPNIKFHRPNPNIPFEKGGLRVPTNALPWPRDRSERASINSFGVGGANAHVIIDSAASFGIQKLVGDVPAGNRLLAFTANDGDSASRGAQDCVKFLQDHPKNLHDCAYTLGMRREHLSYRTFAVVDSVDAKDIAFSGPVKVTAAVPSIIFIFTGQGAQWPTMGSALLSDYPAVINDLRAMEVALSMLGPDVAPEWTLSEELLQPKETSKIYNAEFSQPLCTAVQILVVNLLRTWGVSPDAVLGHSSGEIAAAYAAGALTMEEAVICAFLRGRATRNLTGPRGAMAAVALGSNEIQPYLGDGIVIACENSPHHVTLSGDEDRIMDAVRAIKYDHPEVATSRLQVDMAYHSHHMRKLGREYESQLSLHLSNRNVQVPFFSTVTSNRILGESLDAAYWRSNLESPVLFNTGVQKVLESQGLNGVLVEIGPHSALSGPLRQILGHLNAHQASYVPTLLRNSNESAALLTTAGRIFCKGVRIRFDAINAVGHVLPDLPTYPWNHKSKYWYESRVSKDYRARRFPHHPLIGSLVVEASQLEPCWRNFLRPDSIPWCRDHKINNVVVFPGTGYLVMASEAMRQLSGAHGISLRQVTIASALILNSEATETVISMRHHKLTNSLDSSWHEFTISAYNQTSNTWTKHCFGFVRAGSDQLSEQQLGPIAHCPKVIEPEYWYKTMRAVGLHYGPQFQRLCQISTHFGRSNAVADVQLNTTPDSDAQMEAQMEAGYHYSHPATADACIQLLSVAVAHGEARLFRQKMVPTYIGEAYFARPSSNLTAKAVADVLSNGTTTGSCVAVDETHAVVLQLKDIKLVALDDGEEPPKDPHAGGRDAAKLIHSKKEVRGAYFDLQRLLLFSSTQCPIKQPHLVKFLEWIFGQVKQAESDGYPLLHNAEVRELLQLSLPDRSSRIARTLELVVETEYAMIGKVVCRVHESLYGILRGDVDGLEILRQDDALSQIYSLGNQWDYGPWLRLLSHRTPHLRVLEIGAGTGATTDVVLRGLDTFSSYQYTDVSAAFFPAAKERFRHIGRRMHFRTLDIAIDPLTQANVLHVTPKLNAALRNLLLQEMYMEVKWLNFIMGSLPGCEPYVSPRRWADELLAAGFSRPENNVTIIASPLTTCKTDVSVSVLSGDSESDVAKTVSNSLQNLGLHGFVISVLDLEGKSFLRDISPGHPTLAGMLWLTRPSQVNCSDPQYSGILGLLRVVRNETGNGSLCSLELDDVTTPEAWRIVFQVYQKICHTRAMARDELVDPDCEFVYSGGTVYLPRFHWISVTEELAAQPKDQHTHKRLEFGKRGSLSSLRWIERPILDNLVGEGVYVDVRAVGMNFKDILIVMGVINGPQEAGDGFGVECSGVVRAVGPEVRDLAVGDRVMTVTCDAYATMTKTAASRCIKMPDGLSYEEAASMPCVYPTVIHGLINLARLQKDRTVLIHSACGGIGSAAIQICRMIGVDKIFATVGSTEKVEYLANIVGLPRTHIFSSRDASFLPGVMRETAGRGVDVVLNSLSGELLHASWKCVAKFGSMVEIGKRDFLGQGLLDMERFEGNRAFFGVEMWPVITEQPHRMRKLGEQFMKYYRTGALGPIRPIQIFDVADIESAIRTMQKGQHIGKLVVRIPENASSIIVARPARRTCFFRADVAYLLVGGLGGLGRSVTTWMVEHGAKHFVFLSRSGGRRPCERVLVEALASSGHTAAIVKGSVAEISDVRRAVSEASRPIAGVIQLSMVLRDHLFTEMPFKDWEATTAPKIQGTWNLHKALADQPLDFFVLFSSFAGLVGQLGQANYAAASTFLDAFVQFRHGLGLPASVLDVGAVGDVGFVAERPDLIRFFQTTSHHFLREQDVLDAFELAIHKSPPSPRGQHHEFISDAQIALAMRSTTPLSSPQNRNVWKRDARLGLYHVIEAQAAEDDQNLPVADKAEEIDGATAKDMTKMIATAEQDPAVLTQPAFIENLARRIGVVLFTFVMKPVEELDIHANLSTLGIDSLVAVETRNWLRLHLGIEMSVLEILSGESLIGLANLTAKKWSSRIQNIK